MPQDDSDKEDDGKLKKLNGHHKNPAEESSSEAADHPLQGKDDDLVGSKDDVRKCHALLELLSTEVGYLFDLKVLVTVSRSIRIGQFSRF